MRLVKYVNPKKYNHPHINSGWFNFLYNIEHNIKHMQNTSGKNEQMKYRVHISFLFQKIIEQSAHRIAYTAGHKQCNSSVFNHVRNSFPCTENAPAHYQITRRRKFMKRFQINGIERNSDNCRRPYYSEQRPAENRIIFPQCA